jgi:ABC-type multidrug transport system permease subunit
VSSRLSRHPLAALTISRLREFFREPEAIFWVYGFPVLLAIGLGIAFRDKPPDLTRVDVRVDGAAALGAAGPSDAALRALAATKGFRATACSGQECFDRLRLGRTDIVVVPGAASGSGATREPSATHEPSATGASREGGASLEYVFDPTRPESVLARTRVDEALQRAAGRADPVPTRDQPVTQPGSRYIDFLIPGLLGMNLMGGGLWGIGFVIVDMRVRKLLKRLVATPMRRGDFLISMMTSRIVFMLPEVALLLLAGALLFNVSVRGSLVAVVAVCLLGAVSFAGLGLLVASRAQKIETVSGLMNVVMLPMWLLSGIFFSSDRFPDMLQPVIRALPLTMLIDALRAVILEGATLGSQWVRLAGLLVWGGVSFVLALRWFRWS